MNLNRTTFPKDIFSVRFLHNIFEFFRFALVKENKQFN